LEPKEYERNWKRKNMKEIGTKRIRKKLETKGYERSWKQKNTKEIGTKRM
jgi:hypothetical protein